MKIDANLIFFKFFDPFSVKLPLLFEVANYSSYHSGSFDMKMAPTEISTVPVQTFCL
jgi:hypothetical protein